MKRVAIILSVTGLLLSGAGFATAGINTVQSSTMWFQGSLTYSGGTYTGIILMVDEAALSIGDGISGFDVYAKDGGTAYVQGYYETGDWNVGSETDTYRIGYYDTGTISHDAYPSETDGGPWGSWYDPDCADWDKYALQLTDDDWYLRYAPTAEIPMSGTMDWTNMYAAESNLGSQIGGHDGSAVHGGGAGAWDWDCGWGVEVIPLEYSGFAVTVDYVEGGTSTVSLAPVPEPGTIIVWALLGAASWLGMGVWRRGRRVDRQPWSDENRTAILEIIDRRRM